MKELSIMYLFLFGKHFYITNNIDYTLIYINIHIFSLMLELF